MVGRPRRGDFNVWGQGEPDWPMRTALFGKVAEWGFMLEAKNEELGGEGLGVCVPKEVLVCSFCSWCSRVF